MNEDVAEDLDELLKERSMYVFKRGRDNSFEV